MTRRLILGVVLVALAHSSSRAQVTDAADHKEENRLKDPPANEKTKPLVECLKKMIDVFNKIGAEEGPMKSAAKETAARLSSALADGRAYGEPLGADTNAAVEQHEDPNGKANILLVDPKTKVFKKCDPCDPNFLSFMATLVHEALHLGQPGNTRTPKSLDEKLKKLENECPAYKRGKAWRQDLRHAAELFQRERDNDKEAKAPGWLKELLKDCPDIDKTLKELIKDLDLAIANDTFNLDGLDSFLSKCLRDPKKISKECESEDEAKQLECLDKDERLKGYFHSVGIDGPPSLFTLNARRHEFQVDSEPFDTGVISPQDSFVFEDSGKTWLLVAGNQSAAGPGVVKFHRLERQDGKVRSVEVRVVGDPGSFLGFVTGVARRTDGRFFAFDFDSASIHELKDTTGDGFPDEVGPATAQLPIPPDDLRDFTHLAAIENQLVLRIRVSDPLGGNSPRLVLTDADADGFYEGFQMIHASQFPSSPPCWLGTLVAGSIEVGLAGVHGHPFVVVSNLNPQQPLAQSQFAPFPERQVFVPLSRPLQPGEILLVTDLQNNQATSSGQVEARRPVLHQVRPGRIPPKQETEVSLRGAGLEAVSGVQVDGKQAELLESSPMRMRIRTPKLNPAERYEIELQLADGTSRTAELYLFPDLSGE